MITLTNRAYRDLDPQFFDQPNPPEDIGLLNLRPPAASQYVLRCPISDPDTLVWSTNLPEELVWTKSIIDMATSHQYDVGVPKPYCYVTVRHGHIRSSLDDVWHVDGFSMRTPHVPEQNYTWSSWNATEFGICPVELPADFDPLEHNIQYFLQEEMDERGLIWQGKERHVYVSDPYVIHRRPHSPEQVWRTFVRVSFTAIPIEDRNNYYNPALPELHFDRDGLADFRDQLERYQRGS